MRLIQLPWKHGKLAVAENGMLLTQCEDRAVYFSSIYEEGCYFELTCPFNEAVNILEALNGTTTQN